MGESFLTSLQFKLSAIVLGVTIIAVGLFGAVLLQHVERTEYKEASSHLLETSRRVRGMLAVNHELMLVATNRHFEAFEARLPGPIQLDATTSLQLDGHVVAQLKVDKQPVGPDFPAIDEFTRSSIGSVATIFVRQGDDFRRVATSLQDESGQRAVGTLLARDHPGYRRLIDGHNYIGPAQLFGRPYMTKYQPLLSPSGQVIGLLFVGLDLSETFSRIEEEIKAIRVGQTGHVYVFDSQAGESYGRLLIHPTHVGLNVLKIVESDAAGFFSQALAGGDGTVGRYKALERSGEWRDEIAAIAEFPEWHWVIAAGARYEEFTEQRTHLQYAVFGTLLVAATAIFLALQAAVGRLVLAPLLAMHDTLRASETRFRALVTSSRDLIYTTDATGCLTAVFDKGLLVSPTASEPLIGQSVYSLLGDAGPEHQAAHARALGGEHVVYDWSINERSEKLYFQSSLSPMRETNGRICGLVCIGRDISERYQAEALAKHMAHHDALTGLPNRALIQDRLQQVILHAERSGKVVGLLFIDLDHFKEVNDQFGHEAGDQLLQAVAQRLLGCVRQADTVARIGGDEFVVVIREVSGDAALLKIAEKILDAFAEPFALPTRTLAMSPSIGISSYPSDASDAAALLKVADAAMYQAKKAGRAQVRCTSA